MTSVKNGIYEEIEAWANNAVFNSSSWSINQLDYSEKSISVVEIIIGEFADKNLSLSDDQIAMISQEYGCYLLYTAQKIYGGEFYWNEAYQQPMLIVGEPDASIVLMTWNKVKGRLMGDKADHLGYFIDEFGKDAKAIQTGKKVFYI